MSFGTCIYLRSLIVVCTPLFFSVGRSQSDAQMNCVCEELKTDTNNESLVDTPAARDRVCNSVRCEQLSQSKRDDVRDFLNKHVLNHGVVHLMLEFCHWLAEKTELVWPKSLHRVFLECFDRVRPTFQLPDYLWLENRNTILY